MTYKMPDEIWALFQKDGWPFSHMWSTVTNFEERGEKYHHDRVVQKLQEENKRLREALKAIDEYEYWQGLYSDICKAALKEVEND